METYEILLRPVISEKSTELHTEHDKYTFEVSRRANKIQIRHAVEDRFNVRVASVRTITVRPQQKGAGFVAPNKRRRGLTSVRKKAIVTLQPGHKIQDFFGDV